MRALPGPRARRAVEREPVAYIVGAQGLPPHRAGRRPARARSRARRPSCWSRSASTLPRARACVDVGTGSGRGRAGAQATSGPTSTCTAADVSARRAGGRAGQRASALGLDVALARGDLLDGVAGALDAVALQPALRRRRRARGAARPRSPATSRAGALFAGADGLDAIRRLVARRGRARAVRRARGRRGAGRRGRRRCCARAGLSATSSAVRDLAGHRARASSGRAVIERRRRDLRALHAPSAASRCSRPTPSTASACDPELDGRPCARLYALKGRPPRQARRGHVLRRSTLALAALPELGAAHARRARARCCPARVTLLLPNPARRFPLACGPTRETLGLRVPALAGRWRRWRVRWPVLQSARTSPAAPDARRLDDVPEPIRAGADLVLDGGELPGTPRRSSTCAATSGRRVARRARGAVGHDASRGRST